MRTLSVFHNEPLYESPLEKSKMHAIARLYWIRTNVSSIAASALTSKLNAQNGGHDLLFAVMHL